jgi:RNA polymerase primary sigma factor
MSNTEVNIANKIKPRQVSFDKPLSADGNDEFNLYEVTRNVDTPSPEDEIMRESMITNINRALRKLSPREAEILSMCYGLSGTPVQSLHEIAQRFGMSAERVRQIRMNGIHKLKTLLLQSSAFQDY